MAKKNKKNQPQLEQEDVLRTGLELPTPLELLSKATEEAENLLETRVSLANAGIIFNPETGSYEEARGTYIAVMDEDFDALVQDIMRQNISDFQRELFFGAQINTLQLARALAIAL